MTTNAYMQWAKSADALTLSPDEFDAARRTMAMLAGARAIACEMLDLPSETAVMKVFEQICYHAECSSRDGTASHPDLH